MIQPAPTSKIDPKIARAVLAELGPVLTGRHRFIVLEFANTNYRLRLETDELIEADVGDRILGTIHVRARRIDRVGTGGRYLEPVYGSPRRVQGMVLATEGNAIVVHAGMPIHLTPTEREQAAADFEAGDFITCNAWPGASFRSVG